MKTRYVLTFLLCAAIIFGIVLIILLMRSNKDFKQSITLTENGVTRRVLEFSANGLNPGDSREYTLDLNCRRSSTFSVTLSFNEETDGGMREFIDVTLTYEEETVEYTLAELFDGQTVNFTCQIATKAPAHIRIKFSMNADKVGNEAQKTYTDFTTVLTAERK